MKQWEIDEKERREEAEAEGQEFKPQAFNMEEPVPQPFKTQKVTFVVCLNTLGKDRTFSNEERLAALRLVQQYRDIWEQSEDDHLRADIQMTLEMMEADRKYKESHEALDNTEMEAKIEEMCAPKDSD